MPTFTEPVTIKGPLTIDNPSDLTAFVFIGSGGQKLTLKYLGVGGDITLTLPTPDGSSGQQIVLQDFPQKVRYKTLVGSKIEQGFFDRNGNQWITAIDPPATVINYLEVGNAAAGSTPTIRSAGGDGNVGINFATKGSGALQIQGTNFMSISGGVLRLSLWDLPGSDGTNGQVIQTNGSRVLSFTTAAGANHDMLSSSHPDTTAATVVRGDLIVGQSATPTWQRLALGASGRYVRSDGTDSLWGQLDMGDAALGTLVVARGGSGAATFTANGVLYGNGTGALLVTAQGGANTALIANAGAPSFSGQPTLATGIITKGQEAVRLDPFSTAAGNTGELRFLELAANGTNYVGLKAPDAIGVANPIWVLPSADAAGVIKSNGSLVLSIAAVSLTADVSGVLPVANGGTNSATALNNNRVLVSSAGAIVEAGAMTNGQLLIGSTAAAPVIAAVTGTTNQITVTNGAGTITLATPQDIATASTPQFARLGLGAAASATANNRINLAASGNIVVADVNPLHSIFMPATAMWPSTTAGCAALAKTELATNKVNIQTLDFDQTTQEFAEFAVQTPDNYDAGTVTFRVTWTAASGAGDVVWQLEATSLADDDALDTAWSTGITVTDTLILANDCHITVESAALTLGNTPAAGERVQCRVARNPQSAADTLTADAKLIGMRIEYGINAYSQ